MRALKIMIWALSILALAAVALIAAGQAGLLKGTPPDNLGLRDGRLKPPSKTPNSVSSQADLWPDHPQREQARIAPLQAGPDAATAMARIRARVAAAPGALIVTERPDYLYATFTTPLLRFTDDVEFWFDGQAVQVRSASRIGHGDRGLNRSRIEALRAQLAQAR